MLKPANANDGIRMNTTQAVTMIGRQRHDGERHQIPETPRPVAHGLAGVNPGCYTVFRCVDCLYVKIVVRHNVSFMSGGCVESNKYCQAVGVLRKASAQKIENQLIPRTLHGASLLQGCFRQI